MLKGDQNEAFIHFVEDIINDPQKILKFNELIHEYYKQNEKYLDTPGEVEWIKKDTVRLYREVRNIITLHQPDQVKGFETEAALLEDVYEIYEFCNYLWDIRRLFFDYDDFYIGEKRQFPTRYV